MSIEAGVHPGETVAPVALADTLRRLGERFPGDAARLDLSAPAGASLRAPAGAVDRVLAGLVDNALRAAPAPARVTVEAAPEGGWMVVEVRDAGAGIPTADLAKVGEPFFTTRPPGEGMGLGVFLARRLAEDLGGTFDIASGPGGTRVRLTLPGAAA
jgi:two-component system sensor histidine kinase RegB